MGGTSHHIVDQAQCALVGQGDLVVSKDFPEIPRHHRRRRNLRRRLISSQRATHSPIYTGGLGRRRLVGTTQCATCTARITKCSSRRLDTSSNMDFLAATISR